MGRLRLNMYILVSHTNKRSIKGMIGVVENHLLGMGIKGLSKHHCSNLFSLVIFYQWL